MLRHGTLDHDGRLNQPVLIKPETVGPGQVNMCFQTIHAILVIKYLDVIVQNKILGLLRSLQKKYKLAVLLITHDLSVVAENSDRVGIMYAGKLVEVGSTVDVFKRSLHPYTYKLIGAFPSVKGPKRRLEFIPGTPPDLVRPPSGCRFHPRCPWAQEICNLEDPEYREYEKKHWVACHFAGEINFEVES